MYVYIYIRNKLSKSSYRGRKRKCHFNSSLVTKRVLAQVTLKEPGYGRKALQPSIPIFIKKCFKTKITKYFKEKYV